MHYLCHIDSNIYVQGAMIFMTLSLQIVCLGRDIITVFVEVVLQHMPTPSFNSFAGHWGEWFQRLRLFFVLIYLVVVGVCSSI